jgi:hypothetical protein
MDTLYARLQNVLNEVTLQFGRAGEDDLRTRIRVELDRKEPTWREPTTEHTMIAVMTRRDRGMEAYLHNHPEPEMKVYIRRSTDHTGNGVEVSWHTYPWMNVVTGQRRAWDEVVTDDVVAVRFMGTGERVSKS